ncbi:g8633 [Coccomyxa elongata]
MAQAQRAGHGSTELWTWRLDFPSGTAVFEVDQRDMTSFKLQCLHNSMAQTDATSDSASSKYPLKAASWASVATDLMHADWIGDLEAKGFQKGLPTAYLAEGLLYYLSPDAVRHLLSTLASISAPGSALLFSCINEAFYNGSQHDLKEEAAGKGSMLPETMRKFNEAFQFGIPNDVAGFLGPLGWDASADGAVQDVKDTYKELFPGMRSLLHQ